MYDDSVNYELVLFPNPISHPDEFQKHCESIVNWLTERPDVPALIFSDASGLINGIPMSQIEDHFRKFLIKRAAENPRLSIFIWRKGTKMVLEKVI